VRGVRRLLLLPVALLAAAPAAHAQALDRPAAALAGDAVRAAGGIDGAGAGRQLVVRLFDGEGRRVLARRATTNAAGRFAVRFGAPAPGRYELRTAGARPRRLEVLPRRAGPRSGARSVRALQRALAAKGYVVGARGTFDARTARAVLAFRKVTGMARTTSADLAVMRRLAAGGGTFRVRFPGHGRHVEADISRQVVALIGEGGRVERIYPTSTGAPATPTIRGSFRIYRKDPGTNALGMVHSAYFIRGYAIHGFASVPTYNASHGCLRVPIPDARAIFDWVRYGTRVDTYL
jgi:peptidoglycan hydrolase-like protein with peptidoglycan-binding domain